MLVCSVAKIVKSAGVFQIAIESRANFDPSMRATFKRVKSGVRLYRLLLTFAILFALAGVALAEWPNNDGDASGATPANQSVIVNLFWSATCPHCLRAKAFLERLADENPSITLAAREVAAEPSAIGAFEAVNAYFGIAPPGVPLIVIGDEAIVGFGDDATTGNQLRQMINDCRARTCDDTVTSVLRVAKLSPTTDPGKDPHPTSSANVPKTLTLPFFGDVQPGNLSLPALTVVLGAVDGFNPCAMWVLVFLIGLLANMEDRFRMWSFGGIFLSTSALVYFAFLAAWLNVFLFLGSVALIRFAVALFALAAGGYYMWQFAHHAGDVCPVTEPEQRQGIMARFKTAVAEKSFVVAALGIATLAVAVNLIELLCSAGIPAIYTHILALSDLSPVAHYGYLGLYTLVFLLDDLAVFATAMVTLRVTGLTTKYARYSHLVGAIVLGIIGVLLLVKPQWLALA